MMKSSSQSSSSSSSSSSVSDSEVFQETNIVSSNECDEITWNRPSSTIKRDDEAKGGSQVVSRPFNCPSSSSRPFVYSSQPLQNFIPEQRHSVPYQSFHGVQYPGFYPPSGNNNSPQLFFDSSGRFVHNGALSVNALPMGGQRGGFSAVNASQASLFPPNIHYVPPASFLFNPPPYFPVLQHHSHGGARASVPSGPELHDIGHNRSLLSSSPSNGQENPRIPVSKNITAADVRPLFHKSLTEAAEHFGICTTLFKKVCRKLHIKKWPYRQINCLANRMKTLEYYLNERRNLTDEGKTSYREQIQSLKTRIEKIKEDAFRREADVTEPDVRTLGDTEDKNVVNKSDGAAAEQQSSSLSVSDERSKKRKASCISSLVGSDEWVAKCSNCGKVGLYCHPTEGPLIPHVLDSGEHCGHFREDPVSMQQDNGRTDSGLMNSVEN